MYDPAVMAKGLSTPVFCSLAVAMGCATAQPGPPETAPLAPPPDETSRPPPILTVQPGRSGEATSIAGPDALVGLCQVLRDENAVDFPGNPVERARASASHAERRQAAQAASFVTAIPAAGFSFRTYQMGERRLLLDTDRSLVVADGAELFVPSSDLAPGFSLAPDFAEHLLAERSAGRLALRLVFRPARSQLRKDGCVWMSGGRVVKMEIDIVAAALLGADGEVVARSDGGDYGDPDGGLPVRSPKVTVRKPRGPDGKDLPAELAGAMEPLASAALPCYRRVLLVRPALRGSLVLAIRVATGGKVDEARVEMSSLGDDAVSACVLSAVKKTELAAPVRDQRFSVPLQFSSTDDR
jgi:TonB family protein